MRSHPFILALLFGLAILLLLGGRTAQARAGEPAAGPAGDDALALVATVGLDPGCSSPADNIIVAAPALLTFCYRLTNNTAYTLTTHTLRDVFAENLLNDTFAALTPGATATFSRSVVVTGSVINLATWTVTQPITSYAASEIACVNYPDASSGQNLALLDDGLVNLTLPWQFPFYDRYSDRLRVSNNGVLLFDQPNTAVPFSNATLPTPALPHGLAVFWDDLDEETGAVYAGLVSTPISSLAGGWQPPGAQPQGSLEWYVIEYRNRSVYPGPSGGGSFAVLLLAPGQGSDGLIVTCYKDTDFDSPAHDFAASATIGVNHNGGSATLSSFNTPQVALTGTFGLQYAPVGPHHGFAASASTHVYAFSSLYLPLITR